MVSKTHFCYSSGKARGNVVALRTTTNFIVLKVWNNQLNQAPFCQSFPFIIRLLEFSDFLILQYQSKTKQEKQYRLI